jgi:myo-inositol 2-dehydrogenase/D-chiro-inositol 1-dehydrogenase
MNVLILGDGEKEQAWTSWFAAESDLHLEAVCPGSSMAPPSVRVARDLDDALATPGIDLVLVGGPLEARGEMLRRAAAAGLAIICLHPPGEDSEAYYQVALCRLETGAVVVPDLPLRLHPGVARLRQAIAAGELGTFRGIRHELRLDSAGEDLAREVFPCVVDVVRSLVGEIEALTASGDPPGEHPENELVVQLRASGTRRAEIRLDCGPAEPARLTLNGSSGSLTLEYDPSFQERARLIRRLPSHSPDQITEMDAWDPLRAIVQTLMASLEQRGQPVAGSPSPNLSDGTRATELAEAVVRSLRRGRTIDLHYEAISEDASFKSIMTSTGCTLLLATLLILPLALAGPPLGFNWTIYLAYLIPPLLVVFAVIQLLRFAIRGEHQRKSNGRAGGAR